MWTFLFSARKDVLITPYLANCLATDSRENFVTMPSQVFYSALLRLLGQSDTSLELLEILKGLCNTMVSLQQTLLNLVVYCIIVQVSFLLKSYCLC